MRDMYIGDFFNAEESKESWEDYIKRKEAEEKGQLKFWQRGLLLAVYAFVFFALYFYLTSK